MKIRVDPCPKKCAFIPVVGIVVTVCDSAAEECPIWHGKGKRVHHSFPDPAKTDDMADFRKVRDEIEREIIYL